MSNLVVGPPSRPRLSLLALGVVALGVMLGALLFPEAWREARLRGSEAVRTARTTLEERLRAADAPSSAEPQVEVHAVAPERRAGQSGAAASDGGELLSIGRPSIEEAVGVTIDEGAETAEPAVEEPTLETPSAHAAPRIAPPRRDLTDAEWQVVRDAHAEALRHIRTAREKAARQ